MAASIYFESQLQTLWRALDMHRCGIDACLAHCLGTVWQALGHVHPDLQYAIPSSHQSPVGIIFVIVL